MPRPGVGAWVRLEGMTRSLPSAPTILLVEDTRSDALLYSALLRACETPHDVDHASSLEAGMRLLGQRSYTAVLLDLGLPDSDGLEGLQRIVESHPTLPVVVLTGREDDGLGERAIAAGAQDYLHKSDARAGGIARVLRHARARQQLDNSAREALEELRALFDRNPMPVFVFDQQTLRFLAANAAALAFYGYTREQFLQLLVTDIRPADERARFLHTLRESPERFHQDDWIHCSAGGRLATVQVSSEPLRFQGRDCRIVIVRDVTAQQESRRQLAESEYRYRGIFEHSLGYICIHTLDGVLQSVNPAAAAALGYPREALQGHRLGAFMPAAERRRVDAYLKRIRDHGEDHGVLPIDHPSGETRLWRYHNRLLDRDGQEPLVLGIAHDVTERLRVEQQLRDKTAELEAVNDAAPLGLLRTDPEGRCTYVNRTWEQLAGISAQQALGDGWIQALHPDDRAQVAEDWARTRAAGKRFSGRQRFVHADGRTVWCRVHAAPMMIEGKVAGYFSTVQDITREHEAESARRRGDRRLATLADALPLLLMFLDAKLRVEFINSGWTRELRRPADEILGQPVLELIREPAASHFAEGLGIARGGVEHHVEFDDPDETVIRTWNAVFIPQHDQAGQVDGIHVMLRDVTLDKAFRQDLIQRAEQDPLTGILNRAGFQAHGNHAWHEAARQGRSLGVFFFDLDEFKEINDTLGHAAGDGLLQEVAARVRDCVRADDIVARLGGDEFAVIARHITDGNAAQRVADKLIAAVGGSSQQIASGPATRTLHASCSVGYCITNPAQMPLAKALECADEALYAAKRAGKGRAVQWRQQSATPAP